jgi:hypothetical protein
MHIIRSPDLPAVVLIRGRSGQEVVAVAVPARLAPHEVLELASLIMSPGEYDRLWRAMEPSAEEPTADRPAYALAARLAASGTATAAVIRP